jgi:hypothetical protein
MAKETGIGNFDAFSVASSIINTNFKNVFPIGPSDPILALYLYFKGLG